MMTTQTLLPQFTIAELVFQVYHSGLLTPTHRQQLQTALLNDCLTEEDQIAINRLLHAVRRGWLKVVD
ncbi:hypothetical protein D0A34_22530 [Microcoleus vaginatus PCC 9802]|nr:hypothetical protein D0A34_22530 [Microcoleus vaginatus PCC 9802]UNU24512.1 hypothetical protein D0A37_12385 [Microcoleus vaginatus HSN003]